VAEPILNVRGVPAGVLRCTADRVPQHVRVPSIRRRFAANAPASVTKRFGRYEVPVFRLGRLAVAVAMHRRGLGAELLLAAGARALAIAGEVGGVAVAIDAKDDRAAAWYERFGALRLLDDRLKLVLPLDVVAAALNK
jgi:GNAT superfamily N-acetyltransferase